MLSSDKYIINNNVLIFYDEYFHRLPKSTNPYATRKKQQEPEYIDVPDSVHTIIYSRSFNQKLDDTKFPNSLHTIIFGDKFNQNIDNVDFPYSLHTIKFGLNFDQDLACLENTNVHTIDFSKSLVRYFTNVVVPNTIKEVIVRSGDDGILMLPHGCVEIVVE